MTSPPSTVPQSNLATATIELAIPGLYEVTAVTTYRQLNPMAPPPPITTTTGLFTVAPPSAVTKGKGVPIGYNSTERVADAVMTSSGSAGPYMAGIIQEFMSVYHYNIPGRPPQGPGNGGWGPPQYTNSWKYESGTLYDTIGLTDMSQATWDSIGVGVAYVTWTQELQHTWTMGGTDEVQHDFVSPLGSLNWSCAKVSDSTWEPH